MGDKRRKKNEKYASEKVGQQGGGANGVPIGCGEAGPGERAGKRGGAPGLNRRGGERVGGGNRGATMEEIIFKTFHLGQEKKKNSEETR